ncbi:S-locus lectin protein kinase family protein [Striga asiatica]|uniref:S-locus lectin protein kinase family protein n=1 Tax=Striga asiatica TaxID=4170 RepID=A0A5A7QKE7_STRAF|nr:S-locus lectin protein kinase family protein [Striga asiatica]
MKINHRYPHSAALFLLLAAFFVSFHPPTWATRAAEPPPRSELLVGFRATPDPSVTSFQPLLSDSSGNYSLGFLRVDTNRLSLSIIHVPSSVQLWSANPTRPARWTGSAQLMFNGSLVLSDPNSRVFWSTHTSGASVWLSNASNLIVSGAGDSPLWQSFDFPSDTLVENQNFTTTMALTSSNGLYSLRLGLDYWALYANFANSDSDPGQIYLKHGALEAKAEVIPDRPTQLILKSGGFLGMYQNGSVPVDVQPLNSFQQNVSGTRRLRLEPDGNLKVYYWTGSDWVLDYQAILEPCELPSACGAYGLCRSGGECSCVSNRTIHGSGVCKPVPDRVSGDFCGVGVNRFVVLRRTGVELPFKELMGYEKMPSLEKCERACEGNCTCWGAVYSNSSGFCYMLDFPVQTLVAVGDETKVGYFKVWVGARRRRVDSWLGMGLGLLGGVVLVLGVVLGLSWNKLRSRGVKRYVEEESVVGIGPYKDLSAASFRTIELCEK